MQDSAPNVLSLHARAPYREGDRCPGCTHRQWYIGRVTAECAICGTALVLDGERRPNWIEEQAA